MRYFLLLAVAGLAALAYLVDAGILRIPDEWNPWAVLDPRAAPNWLTPIKLARLSRDDEQCQSVLKRTGLRYTRVEDRETAPGCGFENAVRIEAAGAAVERPFALSCRAAVSFALWEYHVVQPLALEYFGAPVARIEHFGSYACRNIYNRPKGQMSRHATADAVDIAGFVIGKRRVRIAADWVGEDREAQFLHEIRQGACRFFDAVLSPDYNSAHRDHLHLDRGPGRICR